MRAGYFTFDEITPNTGAGKVCLHETAALERIIPALIIVDRAKISMEPSYGFNPFLYDYFAARTYDKEVHKTGIKPDSFEPDILHLSCSPGLAILDHILPKKYVVNIVAHELATSIEEHERYYGQGTYPFKHNTDPYLHKILLQHAVGANVILTPSSSSAKWIDENIKKPATIIPHGCDLPKLEDIKPLPENLTFGYLGAFGPDKGLIYLLMAWKYLPGEALAQLVFGGSCKDGVVQTAKWVSCPEDRISYLGWVNEVKDFYNSISVYIQPSVTEGFGIEVIEAMSYGRPVIVADGTGAVDAVTDGVDGFIVKSRSGREILEKILFFKDNPAKIAEMGAAAKEKAKKYTWDIVESMYTDMYTKLLTPGKDW